MQYFILEPSINLFIEKVKNIFLINIIINFAIFKLLIISFNLIIKFSTYLMSKLTNSFQNLIVPIANRKQKGIILNF